MGRLVIASTVLVVVAGIAFRAWTSKISVADSSRKARKVQIWVDQSSSVCTEQRTKWLGYVDLILQKLQSNDLVELFDISDTTAGASPLFSRVAPRLPEEPTKSDEDAYQHELSAFQVGLQQALDRAFSDSQRNVFSTDIFSLFARFRPDPEREGVLFLLTDGLHVDAAGFRGRRINMEQHLADLNVASFVQEVSGRYRLDSRTLAHARVTLLLPDAAACPQLPKADVFRIREVYGALVTSAGGSLNQVETYLSGGEL